MPSPAPQPNPTPAVARPGLRRVRMLPVWVAVLIGLWGAWTCWSAARGRAQTLAQTLAAQVAPWADASTAWPERSVAALWADGSIAAELRSVEVVSRAGARGHWAEADNPWEPLRASAAVWHAGQTVGQVHVSLHPAGPLALCLLALALPPLLLAVLRRAWAVASGRLRRAHQLQLELERTRAHERWRVLFESGSEARLCTDHQGKVHAINDTAAKVLGRRAEQVVGQPLSRFVRVGLPVGAQEATATAAIVRDNGQQVSVAFQRMALDSGGSGEALWRLSDLTQESDSAQRLVKLANFDSLTGLPNRDLFRDRLQRAMERARRSGRSMALMFLDLDRFKVINDSLGHAVGDEVLRHVAQVLTGALRSVDSVLHLPHEAVTVSRLGGDEFTVIVEDIDGAGDAAIIARRLLEAMAVPFVVSEEEMVVSASLGIALFPIGDVDLDRLLRQADMAMYRSKSLGRNTFSFFSDELNTAVQARLSLESSLRRAVERKEFELYYQPKADLHTGKIVGMEALLRWHCPGKGLVPPDRFIGVLEDTGLILPVGAWVIRTALTELDLWDRSGLPPINVAVNLSARQLRHQFLTSMIEDTLQQYRMSPARLELELTESLLMEDTEVSRAMLANLGRIGVRLAIDDFGTGHSSLAYLRRFNVDTLKIDRSFVSETPHDPEACAIATAVVALGHSMDIKLVAEGVETVEQAVFLRDLGCDEIQGYLLSRPLPLPQLIAWYKNYEKLRQDGRLALYADHPDTLRGGLLVIDLPDQASEASQETEAA